MSKVKIDSDILISIANAIRTGTGGAEKLLPSEMPVEINKIVSQIPVHANETE